MVSLEFPNSRILEFWNFVPGILASWKSGDRLKTELSKGGVQMKLKNLKLVGLAAALVFLALLAGVAAETDTVNKCIQLEDSKVDINKKVNEVLKAARENVDNDGEKLIDEVYGELGAPVPLSLPWLGEIKLPWTLPWAKIEWWANGLGKDKVSKVEPSESKYKGVDKKDAPTWVFKDLPNIPLLSPAIKVNGICIGTDKLGHFFQQGHEYYDIAVKEGKGEAAAIEYGKWTEAFKFGLAKTGIYSNADLVANLAGLHFYQELKANPNMKFDISKYTTKDWNEESNPNFYSEKVGKKVWANLVAGNWKGSLGGAPITLDLKVTKFEDVTGSYAYAKGGKTIKGTITKGKIKLIIGKKSGTNPKTGGKYEVDVVTGIQIDFTWQEDHRQGNVSLKSQNEQSLAGKWNDSNFKVLRQPTLKKQQTIANISNGELLTYGVWRVNRRGDDLFIVASDGSIAIRLWLDSSGWFDFTQDGVEYTVWTSGSFEKWGSDIPIEDILAATPTGSLLEENGSLGNWQFSFQSGSVVIQNDDDIGVGDYGGLILQKNSVSGTYQGTTSTVTLPVK